MTKWGFTAILLALAVGNVGFAVIRREPAGAAVGLLAAFLALEEVARLRAAQPSALRVSGLAGGLAALALWWRGEWGLTSAGIAHLALAAGFFVEGYRLGRPHTPPSEEAP
jgi:hypothetical protein